MTAARAWVGAALVLLTAGCSASAGAGELTAADVESGVDDLVERELGQRPQDVDCPDGMPAEEGASVRCALTVPEGLLGATVTVSSVEGERVVLGIQVDDELLPEGSTP